MSELINKAKIATLQQSNDELINEILDLKDELGALRGEIDRLKGENPDEIKHLREKITEYEQSEAEFKQRILSIFEKAKNNNQKYEVVELLLSALQVEDAANVEKSIEQYYKNKEAPKKIIAFLLGVFVALVAWLISGYTGNNKSYNTIIQWARDNFL